MRGCITVLLAAVGLAQAGTIMPSLRSIMANTPRGERIAVLVHLTEQAANDPTFVATDKPAFVRYMKDFAVRTQAPVLERLTSLNVAAVMPYWIFNGFYAEADKGAVEAIAAYPEVDYVIEDFEVYLIDGFDETANPGGESPDAVEWGISKIKADSVWLLLGIDGTGAVLGSMDTGVDATHPAISGKMRLPNGWFDAVNGNGTPYDDNGHGTHTIGTMVGGDGPGPFTNDVGVAYGAQYISVKILNSGGSGAASWIHAGFQWIENLALTNEEPDAVNNSWGSSSTTSLEFWNDCIGWQNVGIVPVFSSGNSGPGGGTAGTPGNFPTVVGIGATNSADNIASFSSRGPAPNQSPWNNPVYWPRGDWNLIKPNISAPGVSVRSSVPGGGYASMSGTSMASPHVTGVIGLMYSKNPALDFTTVYDVILNTADEPPQGAPYPNNDYGWGRINAYQAVSQTPVNNVPNVTIARYQVDDATGNNNGRWDRNERVDLYVTLRNSGIDVDGVVGTLRESDVYTTLYDSVATYGTLLQGDTARNNAQPYNFFGDSSAPCGHPVPFTMHITGTTPPYTNDAPLLMTIGLAPGAIVSSFAAPDVDTSINYGLAFDGTSLWATAWYGSRVYEINPDDGSVISWFNAPASNMTGITWDSTRNRLWIHSNGTKRIYRVQTNGTVDLSYVSPANTYSTGLAYDASTDELYVVDRDLNRVFRVNAANGSTAGQWNIPITATYGPRGLAIEPRGASGAGTLLLIETFFSGTSLDSGVLYELTKAGALTGNSVNLGSYNGRSIEYDSRDGLYWSGNASTNTINHMGGFYCDAVPNVGAGEAKPVASLRFSGPYPSATRGDFSFDLSLPARSLVSASLYDLGGRRVQTIYGGALESGNHKFSVSSRLSEGVYVLRLSVNGRQMTGKLVILR